MSKFLTVVHVQKLSLFLIAIVFFVACGKKDNIVTNQADEVILSPKQDVSINPLNRENLICPSQNCPEYVVQIFNFNTLKKQQYCVGAYLGEGLVLTTATCIDQVENLKVACENIHVKFSNSDNTYKCHEIKEIGQTTNSLGYMRKKDFAVIKIENVKTENKIEISTIPPKTGHYKAWTILNGKEFTSAVLEKKCLINEPNNTEYTLHQLLGSESEISYQIDCNSYYKFSEGSLIFNDEGKLIGLYSRGQNKFRANLISTSCVRSAIIPELTGENCPIFERQQSSSQVQSVIEDYQNKKYEITLQNKITYLFRWKTNIYQNSQIYVPDCYYDYYQTKKELIPTFSSPRYIEISYLNYLLTHEIKDDQHSLKIKDQLFNAQIDLKEFKKNRILKFNFSKKFESDDLTNYLSGDQIIRGSIYLKLCSKN